MPGLSEPARVNRRVLKVGGSMLGRPTLVEELDAWFAIQSPAQNFVIVGGGEIIEAIRKWDSIHPMPAEQTHWRCVDLLETTFELMRDWMPHWNAIDSTLQLTDTIANRCPNTNPAKSNSVIHLVRCSTFYQCGASPDDVPRDWRTTTDAIAALLGRIIDADEVVLLKSCRIPATASIKQLADRGIVDEALPMIEASCPPIRLARIDDATRE